MRAEPVLQKQLEPNTPGCYADREQQLTNLGIAYKNLENFEEAQNYYEQALAIARSIGDKRGESNLLGNICSLLNQRELYQQSISYGEQALDLARALGDQMAIATDLANMGVAHKNLGDYLLARDLYIQVLAIARAINDRFGQGKYLSNLGQLYAAEDDPTVTLSYFQEARTIFMEIGSDHLVAYVDEKLQHLND